MANEIAYQDESETSEAQEHCFNFKMLPAKAVYLFAEASVGCITPFLNLFYVSFGLTPADAGMISSIGSIFSFLSGAVWGRLTDYTGRRMLIFMVLCLGSITTIFPLPWIAQAVLKLDSNITCSHNSTRTFTEFKTNCVESHRLLNPQDLIGVFLVISAISKLFHSGLISFIEGTVMSAVSNSKSMATFGAQKMFAPAGFALGSYLSGMAVDHYKDKGLSQYAAIFYVFLPCVILLIPVGCLLVRQSQFEKKKRVKNKAENIRTQLKIIFKNNNNILILFSVFVAKTLQHIFYGFGFLFMHDELHLSKTMMSFAVVICMVSELLVYPFSSKLIKLLGGNVVGIIIGISSYFPRFMVISYAKNAQVVLPIQLFHGIGVSLTWTCIMQHTNEVFPKEIVMTAIMVMTTFHGILSGAVASLISGVIYHKYGGRFLFRGASIFAIIWGSILMLNFGIQYKTRSKTTPVSRDQPLERI